MEAFDKLVQSILSEDTVAGGAESAFGPGVTSTATAFSGDNYASGDARRPFAFGGITTRRGMIGGKKHKKRKKRRSKGKR